MSRAIGNGSGDLLADRRFAYAEMAAQEGDFLAARDLCEQVLEQVPDWVPAHFARAKACLAMGQVAEADSAIAMCLRLDPTDRLGAALLRARIEGSAKTGTMSDAFVAGLFDGYAETFDSHLRQSLKYCAPELLVARLKTVLTGREQPLAFRRGLDLGCGTGLMALALDGCCAELHGVDLSAGMLAKAEKTGAYASLACAEIGADLTMRQPGFDLVLAADVFCYVPDLGPVFTQTRRVLEPGGTFAFTIQSHDGVGTIIGADARVHHAPADVEALARSAGLAILISEPAVTRQDRGAPVPGHLFVLGG